MTLKYVHYSTVSKMSVQEIIFTLCSAISACFSLVVVLTGLLWPRFMLSKHRPFSKMIFFISCCDLLGSSANCIGFPRSGSISCSIQAFFYLYFIPASWLWTAVLIYQLRSLILFKQISLAMTYVHAICWSIPLITSLLPLTTNPYGQDDFENGFSPCSLGGDRTTRLLWISTTDSGLSFMLVILMTIWLVQIHRYLSTVDSYDSTEKQKSLFASMKLYPLALLITWAPRFAANVGVGIQSIGKDNYQIGIIPAAILASQYGVIVAIIFFTKSAAARLLWYNLFKRLAYTYCSNSYSSNSSNANYSVDMRETCESLLLDILGEESPEDMLVKESRSKLSMDSSTGTTANDKNNNIDNKNSSRVSIFLEMCRPSTTTIGP